METVEVVIRIPKDIYNNAVNDLLCGNKKLVFAVREGTVLPKGHGDLKDYDAIKSEYIRKMSVFMSEEERMDLLCTIVDEAEVVIEADKEVTNG